ncbi:hypothetical protein QQF64_024993 [Cirrhinus molitorella]|uniref:Uncharacterized protein n=1 Tax=Cirrhinus molitorella TaxID=172907 RepID=A0ABR3NP40_9TELE
MSQPNKKWLVFGRTQKQEQTHFALCAGSLVLENTALTFPQRGLCCNLRERAPSMTTMTSSQTKHSLSAAHIHSVPGLKEMKIKENNAKA